jgi:5-methylcytosine-specific restriction enzyme A
MSTPSSRIRGRKLQTLRLRYFQEFPLCVACEARGEIRAATELDHITPLFKGGTNDYSNYQGLCEACHKDKTAKDLGSQPKPVTGLDGWPQG